MKSSFSKVLAGALFCCSLVAISKEGRTVYKFKTRSPGDSHYLILAESTDKTEAVYIGSDNHGEKPKYFKVTLSDFSKKDDGEVAFTIGPREMCPKPFKPTAKEISQTGCEPASETLTYKGRFSGEELTLTCQSKHGDCWGDDFVFKRTK